MDGNFNIHSPVCNSDPMRQHLVLSLYFLLLATLVLLLGPSYLLAIIRLVQILGESWENNKKMPQKLDKSPPDWNNKKDECQHIPVNCPWIISSNNENLSVIITCLKWTFNYDFWIRVTINPERNPQVSKQVDLWEYSPLLESLSEALPKIHDFPEPLLNYYPFHVFGQLLDYFDSKFT